MPQCENARREAVIAGLVSALGCVVPTSAALAADALAGTDLLSRLDPAMVGGLSGAAGGTIRAMRADVPTARALVVDAGTGGLAGGFAWPFTLAIFGPLIGTLQTTADVILTLGAKVGVAGLLTGVCLSVAIGAAERVFQAFRGGDAP